MSKKLSFYVCSIVIIVSNIVMATIINNGEEITSNVFAIGITIFLTPGFLWAINNEKISSIRLELSALLMLAIISIIRLINRVATLPPIINYTALFIALVLGVLLVVGAIVRIFKKKG